MEEPKWALLPSDIVVHILAYLSPHDRAHAARACKAWQEALQHPQLWQHQDFWFFLPSHRIILEGVKKYGKYLKSVLIGVNQMQKENRLNACALMELLSTIDSRRLTSFKLVFSGENPLFYSGQEFLDSLSILFSPPSETISKPLAWFTHIDLSQLSVPYDDHVIDLLSLYHRDLKYLDIQNNVIVCKVTPSCILRLVQRCRRIKDLRVYHCSMSDDILKELAGENRSDIEHLSITSRRDEKYGGDLSAEAWQNLTNRVPDLRVTLGFDHTCPFNLIPVIMKPEIPVRTLKLETFAEAHENVNLAAAYYGKTLAKLVLQTRNSSVLEAALLNVARNCHLLRSLLVYCIVSDDVISEIFRLHPDMKERGSYILKSEMEPEPWVVGVEEGD